MAHPGPAMHRGLDRLTELDLVLDDRAVRERHPQGGRLGIGVGRDLHKAPDDDPVDEAVRLVGEEEAAVLDDPALGDLDLGRVLEGEVTGAIEKRATLGMRGCYRTTTSRNCSVDGSRTRRSRGPTPRTAPCRRRALIHGPSR